MQISCKSPLFWEEQASKVLLGVLPFPQGGVNKGVSSGETKLPFEGNTPLVSPHGSCFCEPGPLFR